MLLAQGPLFWIGLGASPLPADRPLAGLAAVGGSGLVAAVQLWIGWFCWRTLVAPAPSRPGWALGLAALLLFSHGLGWSQLRADRAERGEVFRVLVLQPALPTREKFEPDRQRDLLLQIALIGTQNRFHRAGKHAGTKDESHGKRHEHRCQRQHEAPTRLHAMSPSSAPTR